MKPEWATLVSSNPGSAMNRRSITISQRAPCPDLRATAVGEKVRLSVSRIPPLFTLSVLGWAVGEEEGLPLAEKLLKQGVNPNHQKNGGSSAIQSCWGGRYGISALAPTAAANVLIATSIQEMRGSR